MVRWRTSSSAISSNTFAEAGILRPQALGKAAVDAAVLVLVGDGKRQDFLLGEIGETFHKGPLKSVQFQYIRNILNWVLRHFNEYATGDFELVNGEAAQPIKPGMTQRERFWREQIVAERQTILDRMRGVAEIVLRPMLHLYWRFSRGLTLGVRGLVVDEGAAYSW